MARRLHAIGPVKFTFALPMYSSGRRLEQEGTLTMALKYSLNYLWITFLKKNYTTDYVDVRASKPGHFRTDVRKMNRSITTIQAAFSIVALVLSAFLAFAN